MVPRCIHINIPRIAETWVARFIEKLVCWDQFKSVNGRIVELESTSMGTWVNWFMEQMGTYSTICQFEAVSGCDNLPIHQATNLPIYQVAYVPSQQSFDVIWKYGCQGLNKSRFLGTSENRKMG
jgi:predicted mannosyl-3-phosphoglycerate phosphatase (HAD superfamily)